MGKKRVYPTHGLRTRTDPTRKTSTRTRPIPAGTGRVRVYPRVRVDQHTSINSPSSSPSLSLSSFQLIKHAFFLTSLIISL